MAAYVQGWFRPAGVRMLAAAVAVLAVASVTAAVRHDGGGPGPSTLTLGRVTTTSAPSTTTTPVAPETTTTVAPVVIAAPVTTAAPRPAPTRAAAPKPKPKPAAVTLAPVPGTAAPFGGLGAWVDVYDWSERYTNGNPPVGVAAIDHMANMGVQTLYIQGSRWDAPDDVLEPDRLRGLIDRARQRGMRVVTWYLPTFEDPATDIRRLVAMGKLPVDGVGVDIEDKRVADPSERSRRLVEVSAGTRQGLPGMPLAAIPLPAVLMEEINRNSWPGFPYKELAPHYDAWMPMDYWTYRTESSGWRDAYKYTAQNIIRLRNHLGRTDLPVHPIGGLAEPSSAAEIDAFQRAAADHGAIGGSIYDYRTTKADAWPALQRLRR